MKQNALLMPKKVPTSLLFFQEVLCNMQTIILQWCLKISNDWNSLSAEL